MAKTTPTADTAAARAELLAELVLDGVSRSRIATVLARAGWKPSPAVLDRHLVTARADIAKRAEDYREAADDLSLVRLHDLYNRASKAHDLKTALDVQKTIDRLGVGRTPAAVGGNPPAPAPAPAVPSNPLALALAGRAS